METRKVTCMAAAAFISSMLIVSAVAQAHPQQPVLVQGHIDPSLQRVVRYGDLNVANPDGQKALMHRVNYAVQDLCQFGVAASTDLQSWRETDTCMTVAWASAQPQIATAFERAQSGSLASAAALTITAGHR